MQPIEYLALHLGKHEDTDRDLDQFFAAVGYPQYKTNRVAWCAAAVGWSLIQAGYRGIVEAIPKDHRLMARAWDVHEAKLAKLGVVRIGGIEAITQGLVRPGDIVTYVRGGTSRNRKVLASGHIDFFTKYDAVKRRVYGLGGNETDSVRNGSTKLDNVLSVYRLPSNATVSAHVPTAQKDKFPAVMAYVFDDEGGYSNHPDDPPTNKGITIHTYRRYIKRDGTIEDLKRLTIEEATVVYRAEFWDKVNGDNLPPGVDYTINDFGVNSGPSRAVKFLQAEVGVTQDGEVGPITLAAVAKRDPADLVSKICASRLVFMKGLKKWSRYGNGWKKRVARVKARSLKMVAEAPTTKDRNDQMIFGGAAASVLIPWLAKKGISLVTGKGAQSGAIGALIAALGLGAATGGQTDLPVGDIMQLDRSAVFTAFVAAVGTLKRLFLDKEGHTAPPEIPAAPGLDVTPISTRFDAEEPDDDRVSIPDDVDTDVIAEAMQDALNGKTLDDSPEDFSEVMALLMSKGLNGRTQAFSVGASFGATAQKRWAEKQKK